VNAIVAPPLRVRLADQREESGSTAHLRLMVMMFFAIGITVLIIGKLCWMAISTDGARARTFGDGLVPERADIVDRNGVPMARTIMGWSIGVRPSELLNDRAQLAVKLAQLMPEHDAAWYLTRLRSPRPFEYLKRRALPSLVAQVNGLGEPGIQLGREPERLYPQGTMAAQALGFSDDDGVGRAGMEAVLNQRLSDPAMRDKPVALSIDSRVQAAVETELQAVMTNQNAEAASALVLDVHTGEVIAMASLPTYNPNVPGDLPPPEMDENGRQMPGPTYNRVTNAVYELGSTFKPITAANAIDSGVVTSLAKRYDATAPLQVGKYQIHDDHPQRRWLDVPEMLVYSSNIVTARIADELGPARMAAMFRKLGFDKPAEIELRAKGHPLFPSFWARTTTMTTGFGHGIAVSPLHLANAYAALVNGGILRPATLLKRDPNKIPAGTRVFAESTSATMRKLLRLIVTVGTGERANAPGFRMGGKTGTAEKPKAGGGYFAHANISTFASAFPMDDPKYVIIAMIDDPKGSKETYGLVTAGMVSAPIAGKIVQRIGPLLGVYPDERRDVDNSDLMALVAGGKADKARAAQAKQDRQ
jgi:cell division protein FtsI (penicillin-binding protein 3)